MEDNMKESINIENIMNEIRAEIKAKGLTSDMLSFDDVPVQHHISTEPQANEADIALAYINQHYSIQPYKQLQGSGLKVFMKKAIRKLVKFYVEPVVFAQNTFNAHVVRVINPTKAVVDELVNRVAELENQQEHLQQKIEALTKEKEALKEKLRK